MCYILYPTTFNSCLIKVINVDCYNDQYFTIILTKNIIVLYLVLFL